jgi:hypothetical protein
MPERMGKRKKRKGMEKKNKGKDNAETQSSLRFAEGEKTGK